MPESLSGPGPAQEARRKWYFSHKPYDRLRKTHRDQADRLIKERKKRATPVAGAVERNTHRRQDYEIELREWEERRIQREYAVAEWRELQADIIHNGGAKSSTVGEDYGKEIPKNLRRKNGLPLDSLASQYGYSYEGDFAARIARTKERARKAEQEARATPRPVRPKLEPEPRKFYQAGHDPEEDARREEVASLRQMIREGEKELGKDDPALDELRDMLKELQRPRRERRRTA